MANVHLDPTAMDALEAYIARQPKKLSKSRAVDRLLATADLAQVQALAIGVLMDENERLKNLRGEA